MIRTVIAGAVLTAGLLASSGVAAAQGAPAAQPAAPFTAADAAPFLGEWALDLQGPNGPGVFTLIVKVEKEKVLGEISGATSEPQPITDISRSGESLLLRYTFNYEGTAVDAVVQLTPAPERKTTAQIDFAGGAYVMTGTATRKEKVAP